jgi:pSer/pThr/pTyr-binding forkhead associated (FHA) protein
MCAIAVNALYTTLRKRGTTRQLAGVIVACVLSALLLLPAVIWYNFRFSSEPGLLSLTEVTAVLIYIALWGWIVPVSGTVGYCLFTQPRDSNTSVHIPRHQKRVTRANTTAGAVVPPRRSPGVPVPFVFGEGIPWGWLVHRAGRFSGLKLELTRAIVSIGREEDNDIWLDDDTASRYHAELAWEQGQVYLTDNNSLNGVIVNGRRMRGSLLISSGDLLEIGAHRFLFEIAEAPGTLTEQDDPLLHHVRPSSPGLKNEALDDLEVSPDMDASPALKNANHPSTLRSANASAPPTRPIGQGITEDVPDVNHDTMAPQQPQNRFNVHQVEQEGREPWQETLALDPAPVLPLTRADKRGSVLVICNGELEGRSFLLEQPVVTIGRGSESDIVINDASISRRHALILQQVNGDYVQDLASRNGTKVNDEPLHAPRLLQKGDTICIGSICLEYTFLPEARTTPLPPLPGPPLSYPISGPIPLRLPSKPK